MELDRVGADATEFGNAAVRHAMPDVVGRSPLGRRQQVESCQAVRVGGAQNHRNDLGSAVLIKDNHLVAAGGITRAIERARARAPHTSRIEVEVASLAELDEAIAARADIILTLIEAIPVGNAFEYTYSVRLTDGTALHAAGGGMNTANFFTLYDVPGLISGSARLATAVKE